MLIIQGKEVGDDIPQQWNRNLYVRRSGEEVADHGGDVLWLQGRLVLENLLGKLLSQSRRVDVSLHQSWGDTLKEEELGNGGTAFGGPRELNIHKLWYQKYRNNRPNTLIKKILV